MYHSRISSPHQIRALPGKHAVCITLGEASSGTRWLALERLIAGGSVMVDNGAFSKHKTGEVMTVERAREVAKAYRVFAAVGGDLIVVVPDVIGDGPATAALQRAVADDFRGLKARLVVPVQGFDLYAAVMAWKDALVLFGPDIVAGIPSFRAAWPADLVRAFIARSGCRAVHFLGGCSRARAELAVELQLDASADSGFANFSASNTKGRMANLAKFAALSERRVAGVGARFFWREGQTRWSWASDSKGATA